MTPSPSPSICVLATSFNRREQTLQTFSTLDEAIGPFYHYTIILVDDGNDGTGLAVQERYPGAHVVQGRGDLYWNGGMRLAWQTAIPLKPDFYLWLNDDTPLRPRAVIDLLDEYQHAPSLKTLVVGKTTDPETGEVTYGGYRIQEGGLSRLRFRRLYSDEKICDTMNGNCVLIPARAVDEIGINSDKYRHAFGDHDYSMRAKKAGYTVQELKKPIGLQKHNLSYLKSTEKLTPKNWRFILFHPKGIPLKEWFYFCRSYAGPFWPLNFIARYIKILRPS